MSVYTRSGGVATDPNFPEDVVESPYVVCVLFSLRQVPFVSREARNFLASRRRRFTGLNRGPFKEKRPNRVIVMEDVYHVCLKSKTRRIGPHG